MLLIFLFIPTHTHTHARRVGTSAVSLLHPQGLAWYHGTSQYIPAECGNDVLRAAPYILGIMGHREEKGDPDRGHCEGHREVMTLKVI